MTIYYFDLRDEDALFPDEEGLEFSSLLAVQEEAAKSLADMARDAVRGPQERSQRYMAIEVRDKDGPVMRVRFSFEVTRCD
jgi:hypothetical protein